MNLSILSTQRANQLKYQLIGYGMIVLLAIILFRGISAVVITAMGPVWVSSGHWAHCGISICKITHSTMWSCRS